MSRFFYGLYVVGLAVLTAITFRAHVAHPPHVAPPAAEALGSLPLAAVGGEHPGQVLVEFLALIEGVQREEERVAAARPTANVSVATGGTPEACAGFVLPAAIVWRESHCTRLGDSGNGYIGAYQIKSSYWQDGRICEGLDWNVPAQEDECALRLWADGAGASHWGA